MKVKQKNGLMKIEKEANEAKSADSHNNQMLASERILRTDPQNISS